MHKVCHEVDIHAYESKLYLRSRSDAIADLFANGALFIKQLVVKMAIRCLAVVLIIILMICFCLPEFRSR